MCSPSGGECICAPGYAGRTCELCAIGYEAQRMPYNHYYYDYYDYYYRYYSSLRCDRIMNECAGAFPVWYHRYWHTVGSKLASTAATVLRCLAGLAFEMVYRRRRKFVAVFVTPVCIGMYGRRLCCVAYGPQAIAVLPHFSRVHVVQTSARTIGAGACATVASLVLCHKAANAASWPANMV